MLEDLSSHGLDYFKRQAAESLAYRAKHAGAIERFLSEIDGFVNTD